MTAMRMRGVLGFRLDRNLGKILLDLQADFEEQMSHAEGLVCGHTGFGLAVSQ